MRPIKLTVSAFGPYAGKTILEMDKLGENGLYLSTEQPFEKSEYPGQHHLIRLFGKKR